MRAGGNLAERRRSWAGANVFVQWRRRSWRLMTMAFFRILEAGGADGWLIAAKAVDDLGIMT